VLLEMTSRRLLKAARAIREVVSTAALYEIKDPRVRDVTVTRVEVMPDMRQAKVYVSVMGDETKQNLSLAGLRSAAGFLQAKVAERIDSRYTPKLVFIVDEGVKKSIEVMRLLKEVLPEDAAEASAEEDASGSEDAASSEDDAAHEDDMPEDDAEPPQGGPASR
jgi:ribosome-binding factor A